MSSPLTLKGEMRNSKRGGHDHIFLQVSSLEEQRWIGAGSAQARILGFSAKVL